MNVLRILPYVVVEVLEVFELLGRWSVASLGRLSPTQKKYTGVEFTSAMISVLLIRISIAFIFMFFGAWLAEPPLGLLYTIIYMTILVWVLPSVLLRSSIARSTFWENDSPSGYTLPASEHDYAPKTDLLAGMWGAMVYICIVWICAIILSTILIGIEHQTSLALLLASIVAMALSKLFAKAAIVEQGSSLAASQVNLTIAE